MSQLDDTILDALTHVSQRVLHRQSPHGLSR